MGARAGRGRRVGEARGAMCAQRAHEGGEGGPTASHAGDLGAKRSPVRGDRKRGAPQVDGQNGGPPLPVWQRHHHLPGGHVTNPQTDMAAWTKHDIHVPKKKNVSHGEKLGTSPVCRCRPSHTSS